MLPEVGQPHLMSGDVRIERGVSLPPSVSQLVIYKDPSSPAPMGLTTIMISVKDLLIGFKLTIAY